MKEQSTKSSQEIYTQRLNVDFTEPCNAYKRFAYKKNIYLEQESTEIVFIPKTKQKIPLQI